jgi:hypothetical protein
MITRHSHLENLFWGTIVCTKTSEGDGELEKVETDHIFQTFSFTAPFSTFLLPENASEQLIRIKWSALNKQEQSAEEVLPYMQMSDSIRKPPF